MVSENRDEKTSQDTTARPVKSRGFFAEHFSNLLDRKKGAEAPKDPVVEPPQELPTTPRYEPPSDDYLGQLQLMVQGPDCFAQRSAEDYESWLSQTDPLVIAQLQDQAQTLFLALTDTTPVSESEEETPSELLEPEPIDASCQVYLAKDALTAWAYLFPPLRGGAEITQEDISCALANRGVSFGIQEEAVRELGQERRYFTLTTVAVGVPPVDGQDGRVLEIIPREKKSAYNVQEDGTVDYREFNQLQHIHSSDVICEITYPTDPVLGTTVDGRVVEGKTGKPPTIPSGKNTQLSSDGTRLISAIDGQVSFTNGKFSVDSVYTVAGDVDSSVGNLDVVGSVVIRGDVLEGFSVRATVDISVSGIVEDAKLLAGGNIQLNRGMNGNQRGVIKAKGDVVAQFLENCTVFAHGNVHAQNIINCTISCDGTVDATKGRGIIIGGTVTACHSVEAKVIGNASHRATEIVLGSTPDFLQLQAKLVDDIRTGRDELEEVEKSLAYLERFPAIPPTQQARYTQYKLRRSVLTIQLAKKNKDLQDLTSKLEGMENCFVISPVIYPGTRITIGLETRAILETSHRCRVYVGPEGLTIGSM